MVPYWVYILRCADGSLYTGITNDLDRRLKQHRTGKASKYTRARRPLTIAYAERKISRGDALRREAAIKKLRPIVKRGLCATWLAEGSR